MLREIIQRNGSSPRNQARIRTYDVQLKANGQDNNNITCKIFETHLSHYIIWLAMHK